MDKWWTREVLGDSQSFQKYFGASSISSVPSFSLWSGHFLLKIQMLDRVMEGREVANHRRQGRQVVVVSAEWAAAAVARLLLPWEAEDEEGKAPILPLD